MARLTTNKAMTNENELLFVGTSLRYNTRGKRFHIETQFATGKLLSSAIAGHHQPLPMPKGGSERGLRQMCWSQHWLMGKSRIPWDILAG